MALNNGTAAQGYYYSASVSDPGVNVFQFVRFFPTTAGTNTVEMIGYVDGSGTGALVLRVASTDRCSTVHRDDAPAAGVAPTPNTAAGKIVANRWQLLMGSHADANRDVWLSRDLSNETGNDTTNLGTTTLNEYRVGRGINQWAGLTAEAYSFIQGKPTDSQIVALIAGVTPWRVLGRPDEYHRMATGPNPEPGSIIGTVLSATGSPTFEPKRQPPMTYERNLRRRRAA